MVKGKAIKFLWQWIFPLAVLIAVTIISIYDFYIDQKDLVDDYLEEIMTDNASSNGERLEDNIRGKEISLEAFAGILAERGLTEKEDTREVLETLCSSTRALSATACNMEGSGVTNAGVAVSVPDEIYKAGQDMSDTVICYNAENKDGVVMEFRVPILDGGSRKGILLVYFDPQELLAKTEISKYGKSAWCALTDHEGIVIAGRGEFWEKDGNLYNYAKSQASEESLQKFTNNIKLNHPGILRAEPESKEDTLVYTPVGVNNWYFVMGVPSKYLDAVKKENVEPTRSLLGFLSVALVIFVGTIILMDEALRKKQISKSKQLEEQADTDQLTGLNNKIATERKIKAYIEAHPEEQGMMFLLDIDNFKKINDTMGHAFGDEVLRTLGLELCGEFRVSDVIGRTGGDEFTLFLKNLPDDKILKKEADRVAGFFRNFKVGEYVKYSATASIGCAIYPRDGSTFESLYKAADQALYTAKKKGKNQIAFYRDLEMTSTQETE